MFEVLATDFQPPPLDEAVFTAPYILKTQGKDIEIPEDKFCWMTYGAANGHISFSRNTLRFFPEICAYTAGWLRQRFPMLDVYPDRIHLVRTRGTINPHRDESKRRSAINIGLRNSNSAITRLSVDDSYETLEANHRDFICQDGGVYLLDTSRVHTVLPIRDEQRLLITMTLTERYEDVLGKIQNG